MLSSYASLLTLAVLNIASKSLTKITWMASFVIGGLFTLPGFATETPPVESPIPDLSPVAPPSFEHAFIKMLLTLGALIALLFLSTWSLKRLAKGRLSQKNAESSIKILERRALSPKSTLYLLEINGKQLLIAESQLEVRRLSDSSELP